MLLTLPALLIDASNLNLRFNPDAAECLTWKDDSETLLHQVRPTHCVRSQERMSPLPC